MNTDETNLEAIDELKPKLQIIKNELQTSITDADTLAGQYQKNELVRYCLWSGQNDDGRKWAKQLGKEPFPWDGCSDARVRVADDIIDVQVKIGMSAFRRCKMQVAVMNSDNIGGAQKVNTLLDWLLRTQCRREFNREFELFINFRQTHGLAVMGIFWEQERRLEKNTVDFNALIAQLTNSGDPQQMEVAAKMAETLHDPLKTEELADMLITQTNGALNRRAARAAVKTLRETGMVELPSVTVIKSLPRWEALRPFVDVFVPVTTKDEQRGRWIAKPEWLTETELKNRAETEGWDADWVEEAIKLKGTGRYDANRGANGQTLFRPGNLRGNTVQDFKHLIQIWHVWYKGMDTKTQAPAQYYTVFHMGVPDKWAFHDLDRYQHGKYPFVFGVRERIEHAMAESRGVAEIGVTDQAAIKRQVDAITDVTDISTLPPVAVPIWRQKSKLAFGPGTQNAERRPGELRWMEPPQNDGRASQMIELMQGRIDRRFGAMTEDVPPPLQQLHAQDLVDGLLDSAAEMGMMTLQLAQQYLPEMTFLKVTGGNPELFKISREEIRGEYAFSLSFDAKDLDMEFVMKKLEAINQLVIPVDTAGTLDRAGYIADAMSWIDPSMAQRLVRAPEAATQNEIADEQQRFTMMMAGVEPPLLQSGNWQLRLETLQTIVASNPLLTPIIHQRPDVQAMLEDEMKRFQFQLTQQQNAQIGRVGTAGGLQTLRDDLQKQHGASAAAAQPAPQPIAG